MKGDKLVYLHRKATDGIIFYVGIGEKRRPTSKQGRSDYWKNTVAKHGYTVQIVEKNLTWEEACESEIALIELIGRRDKGFGTLVNLTDGGEGGLGHISTRRIRVIDLDTGIVYESLTEASKAYKTLPHYLSNALRKDLADDSRIKSLRLIDSDNVVKWKSEDDEGIIHKKFVYKEDNWVEMLAYDLDSVNCLDLRSNRVQKKKTHKSRSGMYGGYNHKPKNIEKLRQHIARIYNIKMNKRHSF